ncbi:MAG: aspartate/glutamate racemase family protein [Tissierella sp.]|uniref:aspartate/glutamate racemase family protein n=1 Tax=Tissierella sp. TaxID=41274 RepID=UPI003F9C8C63
MKKMVGVIAGTPVDTQMGVDFLLENKVKSSGYPISKNAKEQSKLQLLSKESLYKKVVKTIKQAKIEGVKSIFLYCNSLSAAIDIEKISKETDVSIITPFAAYTDFGIDYSSLLVLGANGQSCAKIESILEENNDNIKIWSISALPLVEEIETGKKDSVIFEYLNLDFILKWAESNGIEGIVLGCTHLPYISKLFREETTIPILDPAEKMLEKILEVYV